MNFLLSYKYFVIDSFAFDVKKNWQTFYGNAVAYGDDGRIQVKGDYDISLTCSLLQTIYSSNITARTDGIIAKIKHEDKDIYSKLLNQKWLMD